MQSRARVVNGQLSPFVIALCYTTKPTTYCFHHLNDRSQSLKGTLSKENEDNLTKRLSRLWNDAENHHLSGWNEWMWVISYRKIGMLSYL
jgi:hypothetical protein